MNSVVVRNVKIGEGKPKICVPVLGKTEEEILKSAKHVQSVGVDLLEWRADWYEHVDDFDKVEKILGELRKVVGETPILFTFRTAKEGGSKSISDEDYMKINKFVCDKHLADLIDVEMFSGEEIIREMISYAHEKAMLVVGSNHDFRGTPSKKQIVLRLQLMQHFQADIIKIAVMPKNKEDVIALLLATEEMVSKYAKVPVVTMSMSELGVLSRVSGELFGSAITFASAGIASAPGQIPVEKMKPMLEVLTMGR